MKGLRTTDLTNDLNGLKDRPAPGESGGRDAPPYEGAFAIGGEQGRGIETAGELLALALHRSGYHVFAMRQFASRIQGGHTSYTIRFSTRPVRAPDDGLRAALALDADSARHLLPRLEPGGILIHDASFDVKDVEAEQRPDITVHAAPMKAIAEGLGNGFMQNVAAVGVAAGLAGVAPETLAALIERRFGGKGQAVIEANRRTALQGLEHWKERNGVRAGGGVRAGDGASAEGNGSRRLIISGNQAVALGAVAAGCRFFAGYPITPATTIMYAMVDWLPRLGGMALQVEDEIAAINVVIGAGAAGARAMTATSGPGLSLMTEALGLAGMTETPAVVVDVQRAGPSTGLPTKHEQGNINQMVYGAHGDFPRVVLVPATVEDCFHLTAEAFNIAERYQCPVIVASDMILGLSLQSSEAFRLDEVRIDRGALLQGAASQTGPGQPGQPGPGQPGVDGGGGQTGFRRYAVTDSGISPRPVPPMPGGWFLATGDEHDEFGRISEDPTIRVAQMRKRRRKLAGLDTAALGVEWTGPRSPEIAIVACGSTWGAAQEARQRLEDEGWQAGALAIRMLAPFPAAAVKRALREARRVLVAESNATGQLYALLRCHGGGDGPAGAGRFHSLLKFDGNPILPGEIAARARQILANTGANGDGGRADYGNGC